MSVDPGWYKDPADPTTQRYWDGEGWIGKPLPADATPPAGPPPPEPEEPPAAAEPAPQAPAGNQPVTGPPAGPVAAPPPHHPPAGPPPPDWHPGAHPGAAPHQPMPGAPYPPYGYPPYGFQPPQPPPRPHGLALAPLGGRLLARLIDIGAVFALNVVVNGWFVWQYIQELSPLFAESWRRAMAGDRSTEGLPQLDARADGLLLTILLLATALWFAYEVPAVGNSGQTLGKRIVGIKVVPLEADERIGFGRSFRRWIRMGLPTLLWYCCVGFILQLVDSAFLLFDRPLRQALHDKSARTVVVQVPKSPAPPKAGAPSPPAGDRTDTPGGSA
ncbi:RDD family protein [Polymorphospora lycopeni]|uniref:RDD family protein n=1 Tax=Polymorphospora lycopeni TaxID=3140240 RepID=A0ABV5CVG8_9ACTN